MDDQNLETQAPVSSDVAIDATPAMSTADALNVGEKLSKRNFIMFPLGTFGRDFLYNFFNGFLLTFVLLTKHLTDAQFTMITVIIVLARIFDAFNDPIMGSIVENTRTKWGKYKPWQLIGAILTSGVIIALFNVPLDGWAFIGFLAFAYFMFSITFTMNDISYWGMMPSLTSNPDDRNKLTSFTQLVCSAGGGLAGVLVPILTVGKISQWLHLGAVKGYAYTAIVVSVLMVIFQLFTILGVQEKPLPANFQKSERMKFKDLFKVLFKNDQLLWSTLVMLIWNLISGIAVGNLLTFYVYFEFGYSGMLGTVFGVVYAVLSVIFTLFYPWFSKKLGRNKTLYSCGITLIVSYALMLIIGLSWPNGVGGGFDVLGMHITPKFIVMALCYGLTGWSTGFYMIMLINMANTVEYNEWKTGKRDEAIIFSLRPFTAKMGSALSQGVVSLIFIITGALVYTNKLSELENQGTTTGADMTDQLNAVIAGIDQKTKMGLLACMCIVPMVLMAIALIIYKAKCKLDEPTLAKMIEETEAKKQAALQSADSEETEDDFAADVNGVVTTTDDPAATLEVGEQADDKIEELAEKVEETDEDEYSLWDKEYAIGHEAETSDEDEASAQTLDSDESASQTEQEEISSSNDEEQTEFEELPKNGEQFESEELPESEEQVASDEQTEAEEITSSEEQEDDKLPEIEETQLTEVADESENAEQAATSDDDAESETTISDTVEQADETLEGSDDAATADGDEIEALENSQSSDDEPEIAGETEEEEELDELDDEQAADIDDSNDKSDDDDDEEDDEEDADDEQPASDDGTPRYSLTYLAKLIQAPDEVKAFYSAVKNVFLSYRDVDARVTRAHESIYIGRVKLAKFVMRGKSLELQLALTTRDINKSKFAIEKLDKKKESDYTCRYMLNGTRRVAYASELIAMLMKSKGVEPAVRHKERDFAAELPYEDIETLVEKGLAKEIKK